MLLGEPSFRQLRAARRRITGSSFVPGVIRDSQNQVVGRDLIFQRALKQGIFSAPVEDCGTWHFRNFSKRFPDVVSQENDHTANPTNPEEKVGRQLRRIDFAFCPSSKSYLI